MPHAPRVFLQTPGVLSCAFFFYQEWLPSGHSQIKSRFVKCCRDCCPSDRFSHLSQGIRSFCQSGHWVLHHLPDQGPYCLVARFGQMASSRKSLGSSIFFQFPNDGAHFALANFQHSRNYFIPFPRSMPTHNYISEFYGQFLGLHVRVSALTCTINCGTLEKCVCPDNVQ